MALSLLPSTTPGPVLSLNASGLIGSIIVTIHHRVQGVSLSPPRLT
ncbi:MAG: hypothetical protein SPL58_06660 [Bacteroidaceae bacterium]|nr:hypothetical protein [Bacteroidaceae bacterium]